MHSSRSWQTFLLSGLICISAQAQSWTLRATSTNPVTLVEHATAIDPVSGRLLLHGGIGTTTMQDTWAFDGTTWTNLNLGVNPPARGFSAMATDTGRGRIVLYGGSLGGAAYNDTWEYDGTQWTQATPAALPTPRSKHAMAYDPNSNAVVMFGGENVFGTPLAETFIYDGFAWAQLLIANPPARANHTLEYDENLGMVVLFGGIDPAVGWLSDTWALNLQAGVWINLNPLNSPTPREEHAMAFDRVRDRMVVMGGFDSTGAVSDEWEFDGTNWIQTTPNVLPTARSRHSMDFGPRQELIVVGGSATGLPAPFPALFHTWTAFAGIPVFEAALPARVDLNTTPCPTFSLRAPSLSSDTLPSLGAVFTQDLRDFDPARTSAVVSFGFAAVAGNCPAYLGHSSAFYFVVGTSGGLGSLSIPIPNDPAIAGLTLFSQAVAQDSSNQYYTSNQVVSTIGY